jgi:hypothetical protein
MTSITEKSVLGQTSTVQAAHDARATTGTSTKTLATWMLTAGVAALVVAADQLIDDWAQTHMVAAWLALWVVAMLAIGALRGVSRLLAQNLMRGLDAWSAHVAHRRSDQRLWAMAQSDSRIMRELQTAMDRAEDTSLPATGVTTLTSRRVARMVNNRLFYI